METNRTVESVEIVEYAFWSENAVMGWIPWGYLELFRIVGLPGKGWKVMNDWNVQNISGVSGTTGMSGMFLEGLVRHTDAFLEDLPAFYA